MNFYDFTENTFGYPSTEDKSMFKSFAKHKSFVMKQNIEDI